MNKEELKTNGQTLDIEQTNLDNLKSLFPDCVVEGKLNIDKLLGLCGEYVDNDFEKYSFSWKGKTNSLRLAQKRSTGTLRPCKEESVEFDTTKNLYIEGDNLEVLRLLQTSYFRKVKMIYIDPPYNTGKDFVYEDDFKDPIAKYKEITGQMTKSNPETMGRFHTNWLNMMYPRLRLAANLLTDDGVIFISIDDNEVTNLRKLCDEVFGEENFVGDIIRKTKSVTNDISNGFNIQHENCMIYAKNKNEIILSGGEKDFSGYSNPDNDENGDWASGDPSAKSGGVGTYFEIKNPFTGRVDLPPQGRYWAFSKTTLEEYIKRGKIKFKEKYKENERGFVFKKYRNDLKTKLSVLNGLFGVDNQYMNQVATKELIELFDASYFSYPKPVSFIKTLVKSVNDDNSIILDFFSGSATTAHAVMQLNAEDGGNRKFIMVQLPELTDEKSEAYKAGYKNLCDIGKERIRRAGKDIKDVVFKVEYTDGRKEEIKAYKEFDKGFKVFKLDSSNLTEWDSSPIEKDSYQTTIMDRMEAVLEGAKPDRTKLDILYEFILKMGAPLDIEIKEELLNNKPIYVVGDYLMLICLSKGFTSEDIEEICELMPGKLIMADECFNDSVAMSNAYYILKERKIDLTII